jgi:enterochelin esterase-like enzyme
MLALRIASATVAALATSALLIGQVKTNVPEPVSGARPVTVERITVHGAALEGNLEGNAVDRDVIVFLPPSYSRERTRRYPVIYALHGYSIGAAEWSEEIHVPQTIEGAFAKGAREALVVLPDSKTVHNGSMYSSSVTTGEFEAFIAHDLVRYIDSRYRTIADRKSRGLVGHSMGGYGATRIGMKHADVFGSLYIMSPCCLSARGAGPANPANKEALAAVKTPADSAKLSFGLRAQLASAAAWSPNPNNPPLYLDLPFGANRPSSPGGRPMHRWPSSISMCRTCGSIAGSRSTSAIRTASGRTLISCTMCSPVIRLRTSSRSIRAHTRAMSPFGFRIT